MTTRNENILAAKNRMLKKLGSYGGTSEMAAKSVATTDDDNAINQVYNVALNDRTSLNKLHQIIEEGLIKRKKGLEKIQPIYRDFRPGDVRHSQANIEKAETLLGYSPEYTVSKGLDKTMDWYIERTKS